MRSPTLGCSSKPQSFAPQLTCPLETVCFLLLDLVVALAKSLLSIHNIFSWPISTLLLFSQIGKPVLDIPKEMCGFVTYQTPAASYSRPWLILSREVGWPTW